MGRPRETLRALGPAEVEAERRRIVALLADRADWARMDLTGLIGAAALARRLGALPPEDCGAMEG